MMIIFKKLYESMREKKASIIQLVKWTKSKIFNFN